MTRPSRAFLMSLRIARADTLLPESPMVMVATSSTANLSIAIRLSRYSTQWGVPSACLEGMSTRIRCSLGETDRHAASEFFDRRGHVVLGDLIDFVFPGEFPELLRVYFTALVVGLVEGPVNVLSVRADPPSPVDTVPEWRSLYLKAVRVKLGHRGGMRGDNRDAAGLGFDDGQAETP